MSQGSSQIANRLIVSLIHDICSENDIDFSTYSDGWVLELKKNEIIRRVIGYQFSLNSAAAAAITKDKVATYLVLERAGISSVEHVLFRPKSMSAGPNECSDWGKIVAKPLDGNSGNDVRLFDNFDQAAIWMSRSSLEAFALSPFIDIKREIRIIMLDKVPLLAYEKLPQASDGLVMFNLGLGAKPKNITLGDELLELARKTQSALGLKLSAVDIIENRQGELMVLEVNSGFMMEHYGHYSDDNLIKTKHVYERIIEAVMAGD